MPLRLDRALKSRSEALSRSRDRFVQPKVRVADLIVSGLELHQPARPELDFDEAIPPALEI